MKNQGDKANQKLIFPNVVECIQLYFSVITSWITGFQGAQRVENPVHPFVSRVLFLFHVIFALESTELSREIEKDDCCLTDLHRTIKILQAFGSIGEVFL